MPTQLPDRKDKYPSHSVPTWLLLVAVTAFPQWTLVGPLNPQAAKWISDSAGAEFTDIQPEAPAVVLTAKLHQP